MPNRALNRLINLTDDVVPDAAAALVATCHSKIDFENMRAGPDVRKLPEHGACTSCHLSGGVTLTRGIAQILVMRLSRHADHRENARLQSSSIEQAAAQRYLFWCKGRLEIPGFGNVAWLRNSMADMMVNGPARRRCRKTRTGCRDITLATRARTSRRVTESRILATSAPITG